MREREPERKRAQEGKGERERERERGTSKTHLNCFCNYNLWAQNVNYPTKFPHFLLCPPSPVTVASCWKRNQSGGSHVQQGFALFKAARLDYFNYSPVRHATQAWLRIKFLRTKLERKFDDPGQLRWCLKWLNRENLIRFPLMGGLSVLPFFN